MVYKSVVVASILSGLFTGTADAGCFGNRSNRCQSAPVVCNPCTPSVCTPSVCAPAVCGPVATPSVCNPPVVMRGVGHDGPPFPGRSPSAPLGFNERGERVLSVEPLSDTSSVAKSSDQYDLQKFIRDLLKDDLAAKPGAVALKKNEVLEKILDERTLDDLLAPYEINN